MVAEILEYLDKTLEAAKFYVFDGLIALLPPLVIVQGVVQPLGHRTRFNCYLAEFALRWTNSDRPGSGLGRRQRSAGFSVTPE